MRKHEYWEINTRKRTRPYCFSILVLSSRIHFQFLCFLRRHKAKVKETKQQKRKKQTKTKAVKKKVDSDEDFSLGGKKKVKKAAAPTAKANSKITKKVSTNLESDSQQQQQQQQKRKRKRHKAKVKQTKQQDIISNDKKGYRNQEKWHRFRCVDLWTSNPHTCTQESQNKEENDKKKAIEIESNDDIFDEIYETLNNIIIHCSLVVQTIK